MDKLPAILLFMVLIFAGIAITYYIKNQELQAMLPKPKTGCGCGCATCSGGTTTTTTNNAPTGGGYYTA